MSVPRSSGVAGSLGDWLVVPKGTGPCCQNVFEPSEFWTGRQILPCLLRSYVASIA